MLNELFGQAVAEILSRQSEAIQIGEAFFDCEMQIVEVIEAPICLPIIVLLWRCWIKLRHVNNVNCIGFFQLVTNT